MDSPAPTRGVLLVNVGTPDAPRTPEVRRYLAEFLSDPRVIDLNPVGRWFLLHGIILRTRPRKSAALYRAIWTDRGSPLRAISEDAAAALGRALGGAVHVEMAMRYGSPSIAAALERLRARRVDRLTLVPMFPLNSASSVGSVLDEVYRQLRRGWELLPVDVVAPFFDREEFLRPFEAIAREAVDRLRADHVLFSFHGLPERHVRKSDPTGAHCLASEDCCAALTSVNRGCYRAEAFFVARTLAARLGLSAEQFSVSFQSRLGRDEWIKPYTDARVPQLAQQGVRRLAVVCPAFVADCLETLEEIGLRAKDAFLAAGGEAFALVPSLNADPRWIDGLAKLVTSKT